MPDWKDEIRRRLAEAKLDGAREESIVDEIAQHLDDFYAEAVAGGATDEEARAYALLEMGDGLDLARELRGVQRPERSEPVALGGGREMMIAGLLYDLRYGARTLRKSPGFTALAVLTLALGIGANTAIFSVVHAVLLRPLPFADAERLAIVAETSPEGARRGFSYPNFVDLRDRAQSFDETGAFLTSSPNLTGDGPPVRLRGLAVTWNLFRVLGTEPQLGRLFVEEDDVPGAGATALIGHGLWKERYGGDPGVLGRVIRINEEPHTVVGVLPPDFELIRRDDVVVPLARTVEPNSPFTSRGNHFQLYAVAKLKPGVSTEEANAEVQALAAQLASEYPETNSGNGATAERLDAVLVEDVRPALTLLLGAVGLVLLIACLNVANLMLVRATERDGEIALRLALGARRWRVSRQLLAESLLVSTLGGAAGLLVGFAAMKGLVALAPSNVPRLDQVGLDASVLLFTLVVSVLTGLFFGVLPALHAFRTDLNGVLKNAGRTTAGASPERARKLLLVAEVGLSLVLLVAAGLMLRTIFELTHVDPGFRTDNILTMRFNLPAQRYDVERRRTFYDEVQARIDALPGVRSAAFALSVPIDGANWSSIFIAEDKPVPPREELPSAAFSPVSEGFFETLELRILRGRGFDATDTADSRHVTVVNERLAERLWPGEDPIGKRLKQGWPEDDHPWREVVGVAADVKLNGVDRETPLEAYLPLTQESPRSLSVVVRTEGEPLALARAVEGAIHAVDADLPVFNVRSMDQLLGNAIARQRLTAVLLMGFALLALLLAAVGIFGVMSYSVACRRREIGIRIALGAHPRDVVRLVIGQGMLITVAGIAAGVGVAVAASRLTGSLLYGVSPTDPATFIAVSALLAVVAFVACALPARRATRVDPVVALRSE